MLRIHLLLTLMLSFSSLFLFGQDPLQQGWDFFSENKFSEARSEFQKHLSGPESTRASLALSLVGAASTLPGDESTFKHFVDTYQKSDDLQPYVKGLWSMNYGERKEQEVDFLEMLSEEQTGTLRALSLQALGNHYFSVGNFKKSAQYFAQTGAIANWSVLGEFENVSESGFDKSFGALAHPQANHTFVNKRGVEVNWFNVKAPRYDNWVDMDYFFYAKDAIIYAQNFCNSPKEQDVQFRIGVSGSVKVWVNDQLLFSEAQERNNNVDAYIFTAKLLAGHNRILIQLGESETGDCNFLLRITDSEGNNTPDLSYSTDVQAYDKSYRFASERQPDAVADYFEQQISTNPDQLDNYLIMGQYMWLNDNLFQAKKVLQQARERFPRCAYLLFQQLNAYARDDNNTQVTALIEEIKAVDPDGAMALGYLYEDAESRDDLEAQEEIIDKMEAREGKSPNVYNKRISLASDREEQEVMFALIEEAYRAFPDSYRFVYLKYLLQKEVKKDARGSIKTLRRYLEDHYSEEATIELANAYFGQRSFEQGISTYERLVEHNSIATGYYSRLATFFYNMGQYNKAEEYVQECINIAPYVGSYHATLANSYSELDEKRKAIASYKKAVFLNPYDYDSRRQLRILLDRPDFFSYFPEIDVYKLYEEAPSASAYPDDHSIVLANQTHRVIHTGGGSEEKHTLLVKVFNTDGVDYWKDYRISIYDNQEGNIEKAEVIKANGARIAAENQSGYVVFPNLEAGDAIHITYRLQNYFGGKLANHFWGNHYFQLFLPLQSTSLSLLVPEATEFDYICAQGDIEPEVKDIDNFKLYTWSAQDVPAVKYEPFMSNLADVIPVVHYSSFPDWDYIADWYADLAQAKAKVDFEVEETANMLFADQAAASDEEKAQTIYDYIVDNIRYRSVAFLQSGLIPQKASTTISEKQGDCKDVSTLYVALCKTQGIDANLVLVNTRNNGHRQMMLPSIDFNHCIAKVNLADETYFLELTAENLPFGVGGPSIHRTFVLDIPLVNDLPAKADILEPQNRHRDEVIRETSVSFSDDNMIVSKVNVKRGNAASSMRETYEKVGAEMQFKNMQEAINSEAPGVKLLEVAFQEGLDDNSPAVNYTYSYQIPDVFTDISDLRIFELPFADNLRNPAFLSTESRTYPIELWEYFSRELEKESLRIQIPEGYTLAEEQESELVDTKNVRYRLNFTVEGETLVVVREFEILDDIVLPDDYPEFKTALEQIVKADNRKIAFKAL